MAPGCTPPAVLRLGLRQSPHPEGSFDSRLRRLPDGCSHRHRGERLHQRGFAVLVRGVGVRPFLKRPADGGQVALHAQLHKFRIRHGSLDGGGHKQPKA